MILLIQAPTPPVPPTPPPFDPNLVFANGGIDPGIVAIVVFTLIAITVILWPVMRALARRLEGKTADPALTAAFSLDKDARLKREAARLAAEKAFSGEPLEGIGGEVWRALWDSARRYSTQVAYPGQEFAASQQDVRCVLCSSRCSRKRSSAWPGLRNSFRRILSAMRNRRRAPLKSPGRRLFPLASPPGQRT